MPSKRVPEDELDAGWDVEPDGEEGASAPPVSIPLTPDSSPTRAVSPAELLRRAGASGGEPRRAETRIHGPASEGATTTEDRATVPPPVPESEYVARMMARAKSEAGFVVDWARAGQRAPMPTIPEEDPLKFDSDDVATAKRMALWEGAAGPPSAPRSAAPPDEPDAGRPSAPEIETSYTDANDIEPTLLVDTPVPSRPPEPDAELDVLDDLPLEEVLSRASATPQFGMDAARADRPSTTSLEGVVRERQTVPGVRDVVIKPMAPALLPDEHGRATLTGDQLADPMAQVRMRFDAGDYSGALVVAEAMLEENPNHAEARRYAESCQEMVRQMYLHRLGDGGKALRTVMAADQLKWLTLDHRTGFLLSRIDGQTSVNELLDVSGMPALDALRILFDLLQQEIIAIVEPDGGP